MNINAPLIESYLEPCVMLEKRRVPDGMGGFETSWTEGVEFRAAINKNTTLQASIAEKQGVSELYTVTTPIGVGLDFHEVFRRQADGAIFRVTSNAIDSRPPKGATMQFEQVKAERWELPE